MHGRWFAAPEDCSWGLMKQSYIARDISRNPQETAERYAAKIGEKVGINKKAR